MNSPEEFTQLSRRSLLKGLATLALSIPSVMAFGAPRVVAAKFDSRFELAVEVEIATKEEFRVHRPYVAVWIEDKDGNSVRTLSLWVQTERRGPRWIPDLRRWYRGEQNRMKANGGDLVQTVSSATREAGKYQLVWDGKDDKGKLVDQAEYTLCIEAVREHGTYQLMTTPIKTNPKAYKLTIEGNVEIKGATVELRKRK